MKPPGVEGAAGPMAGHPAPTIRPLALVAAVGRNGVIGTRGRMPWHLPGDLAQFRAVTVGHALLMGRKTFEAIGAPLPGRLSTVLTRRPDWAPPGVTVAGSLDEALACADRQSAALCRDTIMVIGGGDLYAATIGCASTLLLTEVDAAPDGDAWFPPVDAEVWELADASPAIQRPDDQHPYRFTRWARRAALGRQTTGRQIAPPA